MGDSLASLVSLLLTPLALSTHTLFLSSPLGPKRLPASPLLSPCFLAPLSPSLLLTS